MYFHVWLQPRDQDYMLVADLALNFDFEDLEHKFLIPYRRGEPLINKGKTVTKDNVGHLRIYRSSKYLGRSQYRPHRLTDVADEITDELITGPPGWDLDENSMNVKESRPPEDSRTVFLVHGRNLAALDALFKFLRSLDLHPLEWSAAVSATGKASPYIGEILDAAFSRAHAVLVLFTPDDEARLRESFRADNEHPHETQLTGQARPNVLFEAGMAMGRNPDRTILVELGTLRPFTDVAGIHVVRLDNTSQRRQELAQRLQAAGCPVKLDGTHWHDAGDFQAALNQLVQGSSDSTNVEEQQSRTFKYPQLSEDAKELLVEAVKDKWGLILVTRTMGGVAIKTNGKGFGEKGNRRSEAKWEQAIRELLNQGLIEDQKGQGNVFEVTHKGFDIADGLGTSLQSNREI